MKTARLTEQWTPTLVEAYGDTPMIRKGRQAELLVIDAFAKWGYEVIDRESDYQSQKHGIDLEIKKEGWKNFYSIDVKANMNKYGSFFVETKPDGWLRASNKTSDRICHVCVETGWIAWYSRQDMVKWLRDNSHLRDGLFEVTTRHKLDFISKRKIS